MTMAACGSVTAETLGFEASQAIPAAKGTLPKGLPHHLVLRIIP